MSTPKKVEVFLQETIKQVKFLPDRLKIRKELESHILDRMDDLVEQGEKDPEGVAVTNMGDSKEIGRALNREHNSVLGWTSIFAGVVVIVLAIPIFLGGAKDLYSANFKDYSKEIENAVIHVKTDIVIPMVADGEVIHYTDFMVTEDNKLIIISKIKDKVFFPDNGGGKIAITAIDEELLQKVSEERNINIALNRNINVSTQDFLRLEHILTDENDNEIYVGHGSNFTSRSGNTRHNIESYQFFEDMVPEQVTVMFDGYGDRDYQFTVKLEGGES